MPLFPPQSSPDPPPASLPQAPSQNSPESPPEFPASAQDQAGSASPRRNTPCPQSSLCPGSRSCYVGPPHCCAPTAQANPPLPLPATPDALVPPRKPPRRTAQTSPRAPRPYENYSRYTSSDRTVLERRSPNVSLPQNSSIFTLQLRPSHWPPPAPTSPTPNLPIAPSRTLPQSPDIQGLTTLPDGRPLTQNCPFGRCF